ncbi:unnamed protein product [Rotaria sp. Silwood2]|nr:unnamed protein product [Rotaria sp. Silwood2]CAF4430887.1 unnamed protein product [Rotaria sp. Silwood2]CAF4487318.1 unnamed protein product [Rotaria sp. Silwood2]
MLEFFFLILFYQATLALLYNDPCAKKCNFPGMICINNVCKCDSKSRLFWTGARCSSCPNDWTMTACITYYATKMSWQGAEATCRNVKAELISFRDKSIIPLIYNASIKSQNMGINALSAWTSARAINISGLGVYKWLDKSITPFNSNSDWWCKKSTPNLGYTYHYDEPTKLISPTKEVESCVNYWRGQPNTQVVCLDDQLCSRDYPFVCEKSESSETVINTLSGGSVPNDQTSGFVDNKTNMNNIYSTTSQPKTVIGVLVLLALLGGIFCFLKSRNSTRFPQKSLTIDSNIKEESIHSDINANDDAFNLNNPPPSVNRALNIDVKKQQEQQQQNKRGGYAKQQFDEFE